MNDLKVSHIYVRFKVLRAVNMKSIVLWDGINTPHCSVTSLKTVSVSAKFISFQNIISGILMKEKK
jgi:hypothetical protein